MENTFEFPRFGAAGFGPPGPSRGSPGALLGPSWGPLGSHLGLSWGISRHSSAWLSCRPPADLLAFPWVSPRVSGGPQECNVPLRGPYGLTSPMYLFLKPESPEPQPQLNFNFMLLTIALFLKPESPEPKPQLNFSFHLLTVAWFWSSAAASPASPAQPSPAQPSPAQPTHLHQGLFKLGFL